MRCNIFNGYLIAELEMSYFLVAKRRFSCGCIALCLLYRYNSGIN